MKYGLPNHIQRGMVGILLLVAVIYLVRLHVRIQQQEERIAILENQQSAQMEQIAILSQRTDTIVYVQDARPSYYRREAQTSVRREVQQISRHAEYVQDSIRGRYGNNTKRETEQTVTPKFNEAHKFDLNTIDSLNLIRIPGIAARTASIILTQRARYGGFYSPEQLREFLTWDAAQRYMSDWCEVWFTADPKTIRKIEVNTADVKTLQRHPYINHEQAVEIYRYRLRNKTVTVKDLQQLPSFTQDDIERLKYYL